jgi:hypothetical protein
MLHLESNAALPRKLCQIRPLYIGLLVHLVSHKILTGDWLRSTWVYVRGVMTCKIRNGLIQLIEALWSLLGKNILGR